MLLISQTSLLLYFSSSSFQHSKDSPTYIIFIAICKCTPIQSSESSESTLSTYSSFDDPGIVFSEFAMLILQNISQKFLYFVTWQNLLSVNVYELTLPTYFHKQVATFLPIWHLKNISKNNVFVRDIDYTPFSFGARKSRFLYLTLHHPPTTDFVNNLENLARLSVNLFLLEQSVFNVSFLTYVVIV